MASKNVSKPKGPHVRHRIEVDMEGPYLVKKITERLEAKSDWATGRITGWNWEEEEEIVLGGFECVDEYPCCCGIDVLVKIIPNHVNATLKSMKELISTIKSEFKRGLSCAFTEKQIKEAPQTIAALKACGFKASPQFVNPDTGNIITMFNYYPPMAAKGKK